MTNFIDSSDLFAKPSFVGGFSSILDLGNTLNEYNKSNSEEEADTKALRRDWEIVGSDLNSAIQSYEQQTHTK